MTLTPDETALAVTRHKDGDLEAELCVIAFEGEQVIFYLDGGETLAFDAQEFRAAYRPSTQLEAA